MLAQRSSRAVEDAQLYLLQTYGIKKSLCTSPIQNLLRNSTDRVVRRFIVNCKLQFTEIEALHTLDAKVSFIENLAAAHPTPIAPCHTLAHRKAKAPHAFNHSEASSPFSRPVHASAVLPPPLETRKAKEKAASPTPSDLELDTNTARGKLSPLSTSDSAYDSEALSRASIAAARRRWDIADSPPPEEGYLAAAYRYIRDIPFEKKIMIATAVATAGISAAIVYHHPKVMDSLAKSMSTLHINP